MKILFYTISLLFSLSNIFAQQKYFETKYSYLVSLDANTINQFNTNYLIAGFGKSSLANVITKAYNLKISDGQSPVFVSDIGYNFSTTSFDSKIYNNFIFSVGDIKDSTAYLINDYSFLYITKYNIQTEDIERYSFDNDPTKIGRGTAIALNENNIYVIDTTYFDFEYNCSFSNFKISENNTVYTLATIENQPFADTGKILFCEIDSNGHFLNQKVINHGLDEEAYDFTITREHEFIITFSKKQSNWYKPVVYKLDSNFNTVWDNDNYLIYGSFTSVVPVSNGDFLLAGENYDQSDNQACLVKIDSEGNKLWQRFNGDEDDDYFKDLIFTDYDSTGLSGYALCGRTDTLFWNGMFNSSIRNIYFVKTNCMGLLTLPQSDFSILKNDFTVHFENLSQNVYADEIDGGAYILYFGDGDSLHINSDSITTFSHTYSGADYYTAQLKSIVCNDTSIFEMAVCPGIDDNSIDQSFEQTISTTNTSATFDFSNFSADANFYKIDFGDSSALIFSLDTVSNYVHNYLESGIYIIHTTGYFCNATLTKTDTLCVNVNPIITFDIQSNAFQNSDSTLLLQIENNSSAIDSLFAIYAYTINNTLTIASNEAFLEIELPISSYLTFEIQTEICGQFFSETYVVDVILSNDNAQIPNKNIKCYPNPFTEFIAVQFETNLLYNQYQIAIYDAKGKLVVQQNLANNRIATLSFESGIYFYKISSTADKNIISSGTLVK